MNVLYEWEAGLKLDLQLLKSLQLLFYQFLHRLGSSHDYLLCWSQWVGFVSLPTLFTYIDYEWARRRDTILCVARRLPHNRIIKHQLELVAQPYCTGN